MEKEQTKSEKLYSLRLTHDYWDGPGYINETGEVSENRRKAGEIIQVPMEEALHLLENKKAERVDPLS